MSDGDAARRIYGDLDTHLAAASTMRVRMQGDADGIAVRSYTRVISQFATALEEIDRIADPEARRRPTWFVVNTEWRSAQRATVMLAPRLSSYGTAAASDPRVSSTALWSGVRALASVPEIPASFSDRVVERIRAVSAEIKRPRGGLQAVSLFGPGPSHAEAAPLSDDVRSNAERAVDPASFAYGSVVGTLDVISARRHKRRVGLLIDHGPGITCDVGSLSEADYFDAFERRVVVEGIFRRNGRGQPVRMDAMRIEVLPQSPRAKALDLLGALPPLLPGVTAVQYVAEDRGE